MNPATPPAEATRSCWSKIILGTAQFGMRYGVANRRGQVPYRDVCAILETAAGRGVTGLDTAAAYGDSETVIGRALRETGLQHRLHVVTKVRHLTETELADPSCGAAAVEDSVDQSRRRLRLDCLSLVLFHREIDARYLDVLDRLRDRGWLDDAGVSCHRDPVNAARLAADPRVDALQLPASLLDRGHLDGGSCRAAADHDVTVFARSIYLQGLLLLPEADIPAALQAVIPWRRAFEQVAHEAGLDLAELALRWMLDRPGVTSLVTGVDSVDQLHTNLDRLQRGPLPVDIQTAIRSIQPDLPSAILDPARWPKT